MSNVAVAVYVRDGVVCGVKSEVPIDIVVVDYDNIDAGDPFPEDYTDEFKARLKEGIY